MVSSLTLPRHPLFDAIATHDPNATAVVHCTSGRTFRYGELLGDVARAKTKLYAAAGKTDLNGERVAFLVENGYDYVVTLLAVFAARAIAVPLSGAFPAAELQYILGQSGAIVLVSSSKFAAKAKETLATCLESPPAYLELEKHMGRDSHDCVTLDGDVGKSGMMLYTSGTTSRPKGVLLPSAALMAQTKSLKEAWAYSPSDHLLHVLPLHHIHGTVNGVLTPLFAGSSIEFLFPFNADAVWKRFAAPFLATNGTTYTKPRVTFFTVVPTVYSRLIGTIKGLPEEVQRAAKEAIKPAHLRVNISGSAALPTPLKKAWADLSSGNVLLERYGMTEVGMALSCGLAYGDRVDGSVGWPLPGVEVRLVELDTGAVIQPGEEVDSHGRERQGEIQLRGPTIFREYFRNPTATANEFVADGEGGDGKWFKTGDVAVRRTLVSPPDNPEIGSGKSGPWATGKTLYFIQGRKSADIIKSGGEKVSALEVERELLSLPQVAEAAVMAVPSGKWGQKVGCVIVLDKEVVGEDGKWTPLDMRKALRGRLVNYKIPQLMKVVDHIPRNAMGKINKKVLVKAVFEDEFSGDEI